MRRLSSMLPHQRLLLRRRRKLMLFHSLSAWLI